MRIIHIIILCVCLLLSSCDDQKSDPSYEPKVDRPVFSGDYPAVLFDAAHRNFHTIDGTYKAFAQLIRSDGYSITVNSKPFSADVLAGYRVLVISNAKGNDHKYDPAFTPEECTAVETWVRNGGSLLLIADHYPFGSAAKELSARFGVVMSGGFTNDSVYCDSGSVTGSALNGHSQLMYSRRNNLLGDHPILWGRDSSEQIRTVKSFTGQSLSGPAGSNPILRLSSSAYDILPDSIWQETEMIFFTNTVTRFGDPVSAAGMNQAIALEFGDGRVVVLGEAAMITAQVTGQEHWGMQVPGIDNRQLTLNIMHWLSKIL